MMELPNVVQWAGDNFAKLLPWRVVNTYERGVRFTVGLWPQRVGPGPCVCIWLLHDIKVFPVVEEIIKLGTQSVMTADGKSVCFRANIGVEVKDPVKRWCNVQDFEEAVKDRAETHLAEKVKAAKLDDLRSEKGIKELEASLTGTLTTRLKHWGAEVTHVGFRDFVEVEHQVRLFQDDPAKAPVLT